GTINFTGPTLANAILIVGNTTPTVINEANNSLTLTNGALFFTGSQSATVSGGSIALGAVEGIIETGAGVSAAIASSITNTTGAGLTVGGAGTVNLSGTNSYTNTSATQTVTITGGP